ncbi:hypothetical protein H5410_021216 [Solanum commersonii]|uniref:DUF4283 domain-containing protein n=1 Tax=Solanum commersonii TaxID=4109 RepID=A0A9J5ZDC4_SOLCO|nr:hypothetical protein H5410_021216 [Solanum commersonii]
MNDGMFLFEFSSWKTSEHVMEGEWSWRRMPLKLEWWKPTTGCWPAEIRRDWVWIRVLGIPLNLWSEEIFKLIRERCRGFIEMEEETTLKNHLHWASIKVKGDGARVPREIEVNSEGFVYQILIWCETPVIVKKEETKKEGSRYYPEDNREHESFLVKEVTFPQHESFLVKEVTFPQLSHVGTSKEGSNSEDQLVDIINIEILANTQDNTTSNSGEEMRNLLGEGESRAIDGIQTKTIAPLEVELQVNQGEERERQIETNEGETDRKEEEARPLKIQILMKNHSVLAPQNGFSSIL